MAARANAKNTATSLLSGQDSLLREETASLSAGQKFRQTSELRPYHFGIIGAASRNIGERRNGLPENVKNV